MPSDRAKQLREQLWHHPGGPAAYDRMGALIQAAIDDAVREERRRAEWARLLAVLGGRCIIDWPEEDDGNIYVSGDPFPCTFDAAGIPEWSADLEARLRELL